MIMRINICVTCLIQVSFYQDLIVIGIVSMHNSQGGIVLKYTFSMQIKKNLLSFFYILSIWVKNYV